MKDMAIEAPVREAPILIPEPRRGRRKGFLSTTRGKIGAAVIAGALTMTGIGTYQAMQSGDNNPRPTPIAGGIGEPSPTPTPEITIKPSQASTSTPEASPSASPTPIPIESFPAGTPAPTETLSGLEQTLQNWTDGKIKVPDVKKFKLPTGGLANLNIIDNKPQPLEQWLPRYQGYYLESQIIDNHLIAYFGQQDSKGNNYFVPLNIGELNKGYIIPVFEDPNRSAFPSGTANVKLVPVEQFEKIMVKFKDDAAVFILFPYVPSAVSPMVNAQEVRAQAELARQFSEWSIAVTQSKSYTDSALFRKYPLVKGLINKMVTGFDAKAIPSGLEWWIPTKIR